MKKLLLLLLLVLPSFLMSQSYIGQKYDDFFEKMVNKHRSEIFNGPGKRIL